jgi:hypothetical protein
MSLALMAFDYGRRFFVFILIAHPHHTRRLDQETGVLIRPKIRQTSRFLFPPMALSDPPLTPAQVMLASLPVESFLYGVFMLLFCLSTGLFYYRHRYQRQTAQGVSASGIRPVLILSILVFITVTGVSPIG